MVRRIAASGIQVRQADYPPPYFASGTEHANHILALTSGHQAGEKGAVIVLGDGGYCCYRR
jgi:hypothetical protein